VTSIANKAFFARAGRGDIGGSCLNELRLRESGGQGEMFELDLRKIACHVCKNEIPKSAALNAEGAEYVHFFCNVDCLDYWKKEQAKEEQKKD